MRRVFVLTMALGLVACGQPPEEAPAPKAPVAKTAPAPVKPSSAPAKPASVMPPVYATQDDCKKSGGTVGACNRAEHLARAMAVLDAPRYTSEERCRAVFQTCMMANNLYIPAVTSFGLGGNTQTAPSSTNPTQIVPVYTTKDGDQAVIISTSTKQFSLYFVSGKRPPQSMMADQ